MAESLGQERVSSRATQEAPLADSTANRLSISRAGKTYYGKSYSNALTSFDGDRLNGRCRAREVHAMRCPTRGRATVGPLPMLPPV